MRAKPYIKAIYFPPSILRLIFPEAKVVKCSQEEPRQARHWLPAQGTIIPLCFTPIQAQLSYNSALHYKQN